MQEWLKELLGEAYTPQLEEALAAELARRFVNREELDAARTQAADWKKKAEQAQKTAEEQVAAVRFDAQRRPENRHRRRAGAAGAGERLSLRRRHPAPLRGGHRRGRAERRAG